MQNTVKSSLSKESDSILKGLASMGCSGEDIARTFLDADKVSPSGQPKYQSTVSDSGCIGSSGIEMQDLFNAVKNAVESDGKKLNVTKKSRTKVCFSVDLTETRRIDIELMNGSVNVCYLEDCNEISCSDACFSSIDECVGIIRKSISENHGEYRKDLRAHMTEDVYDIDTLRAISFLLVSLAFENDIECFRTVEKNAVSVIFLLDKRDSEGNGDFVDVEMYDDKRVVIEAMIDGKKQKSEEMSFVRENGKYVLDSIISR